MTKLEKIQSTILKHCPPKRGALATIPILGYSVIGPLEDGIFSYLESTDLDIHVTMKKRGLSPPIKSRVAIPAEIAVKTLGFNQWQQAGDSQIALQGDSITLETAYKNAAEYPCLPSTEHNAPKIAVKVDKNFLRALEDMLLFTSKDKSRPAICSVFFHIPEQVEESNEKQQLNIVATNGYMLRILKTPLVLPLKRKIESIIPARAIEILAKILKHEIVSELTLYLEMGRAHGYFQWDVGEEYEIILAFEMVEGPYPAYESVTSQAKKDPIAAEMILQSDSILPALKTIKKTVGKAPTKPGIFCIRKKDLILSCKTEDTNMIFNTIPFVGRILLGDNEHKKDELKFMVNVGYLIDIIGGAKSFRMCVPQNINSRHIPLVFTSETTPETLSLLMTIQMES